MDYWRWARSYVYDAAIVWFTAEWYKRVLERISPNSLVLDVGIGAQQIIWGSWKVYGKYSRILCVLIGNVV